LIDNIGDFQKVLSNGLVTRNLTTSVMFSYLAEDLERTSFLPGRRLGKGDVRLVAGGGSAPDSDLDLRRSFSRNLRLPRKQLNDVFNLLQLSNQDEWPIKLGLKIILEYIFSVLWSRSRKEPELLTGAGAGMSKFLLRLRLPAPGQVVKKTQNSYCMECSM
jgi:hypothetical protein